MMDIIKDQSKSRLQVPPFVAAQSSAGERIESEPLIAGFDHCNFVFLDTSPLPSHSVAYYCLLLKNSKHYLALWL